MHVSEFGAAGGAELFMREKGKVRRGVAHVLIGALKKEGEREGEKNLLGRAQG